MVSVSVRVVPGHSTQSPADKGYMRGTNPSLACRFELSRLRLPGHFWSILVNEEVPKALHVSSINLRSSGVRLRSCQAVIFS